MARSKDPISVLRGIGPARIKQFAQLGVHTLWDLICLFPRDYQDRTKILPIAKLQAGEAACFRGMVMNSPRTAHIRKGLDITRVQVADSSARLNLTFFNRKFGPGQLECGQEYVFFGTVDGEYSGYQMTNPVFEPVDAPPGCTRRILPIYPLTAGLSNTVVQKAVMQALYLCEMPEEILPDWVRSSYGIMPAEQAYRIIHSPRTMEEAAEAKKRMIFEEFFVFSAGLSLMRANRMEKKISPFRQTDMSEFCQALPFRLTGAQEKAIREIMADFCRGTPMNRLVQGDVGSGKTMVAAAAAWCAAENHCQTALMAPTEILAEQHYRTLSSLLEPLGVRVGLLTGSLKAGEKKKIREQLRSGQLDVAVGTHALITGSTDFSRLGLVITDEQHRFGVAQRAALAEKADVVHVLIMSATPIPRTLAMLMYGDLDVSVLDELPPGRQKVDTFLVDESYRARINNFIRSHAQAGHQCFVVCPAVEENDQLDLTAATVWADTLQKTVFPDLRVLLLHGQMKGAEKDAVMAAFARGEGDVLVATTVIEVGVDVPNATLMIVEDADRFGLSQLHQLRGRVGRGQDKSYCILVSQTRNPETRARLKALCATSDGFRIAEEDLNLRGPGDFFGSRQSGLPMLRVANLGCDVQTMKDAREASAKWIDSHAWRESREGAALLSRVAALFDGGTAS